MRKTTPFVILLLLVNFLQCEETKITTTIQLNKMTSSTSTKSTSLNTKVDATTSTSTKSMSLDTKVDATTSTSTKSTSLNTKVNATTSTSTKSTSLNTKVDATTSTSTKSTSLDTKVDATTSTSTKSTSLDTKVDATTSTSTKSTSLNIKVDATTSTSTKSTSLNTKVDATTSTSTKSEINDINLEEKLVNVPLWPGKEVLYSIHEAMKKENIRINLKEIKLIEPKSFSNIDGWFCEENVHDSLFCKLRSKPSQNKTCDVKKLKAVAQTHRYKLVLTLVWHALHLPAPMKPKKYLIPENIDGEGRPLDIPIAELALNFAPNIGTCEIANELKNFITANFKSCTEFNIGLCSRAGKLMVKRNGKQMRVTRCGGYFQTILSGADVIWFKPEKRSLKPEIGRFSYVCKSERKIPVAISKSAVLELLVENKNSRPEFTKKAFIANFVPFNLMYNNGQPVSELLDGGYKMFSDGGNTNKADYEMYRALVKDADDPQNRNGGLIISKLSDSLNYGKFFFKCDRNVEFAEIPTIEKGKGLMLNRMCRIKFHPRNNQTIWKLKAVFLKVYAWDGSVRAEPGKIMYINMTSNAISEKSALVYFVKQGCNGIIGICKKERKCDNQTESDAKTVCNECILGNTGKTERDVLECNVCKQKPNKVEASQVKSLSDVVTSLKNNTTCKKECGKVIMGVCGKCVESTEANKLVHCGKCLKEGEIPADCVFPKVVEKNSRLSMCPVSGSVKGLSCTLKNSSGQSCKLSSRPLKNKCGKFIARKLMMEERMSSLKCMKFYLGEDCKAGKYTLKCESAGKALAEQSVEITEAGKPSFKLNAKNFKIGKQLFSLFEINTLQSKSYECCIKPCKRNCCFPLKVEGRNATCPVIAPSDESELYLFIRDCIGSVSDAVKLSKSCDASDEPIPMKPSIKTRGNKKWIQVGFDKPIPILKDVKECENFKRLSKTKMRIFEERIVGGNISIPNKCFKNCRTTGVTELPIPKLCEADEAPEEISFKTCGNLIIRSKIRSAVMKWNVEGTDLSEGNKIKLEKELANQKRAVLYLKDQPFWSIGGKYVIFKACGNDTFGRDCCKKFNVSIKSSVSSELTLTLTKISKDKQIVKALIKPCSRSKRIYPESVEWTVKDKDGNYLPSGSLNRILKIDKRFSSNADRELVVRAVVEYKHQNLTAEIKVNVSGVNLHLKIMRGQKKMCVPCTKTKFKLFSRLNIKPGKDDTFHWSCKTADGSECFLKDIVPNQDSKILNFGENALSDILECNSIYNFEVTYNLETTSDSLEMEVAETCGASVQCRASKYIPKIEGYTLKCSIKGAKKEDIAISLNKELDDFASDYNISKIKSTIEEKDKGQFIMSAEIKYSDLVMWNKYRFVVSAGSGTSVSVDVDVQGTPSQCEFIFPKENITMETPVTVMISGCSADDSTIQYIAGTIIDGQRKVMGKAEMKSGTDNLILLDLGTFYPSKEIKIFAAAYVSKYFQIVNTFTFSIDSNGASTDQIAKNATREAKQKALDGDAEEALNTIGKALQFQEENVDSDGKKEFIDENINIVAMLDNSVQKFSIGESLVKKTDDGANSTGLLDSTKTAALRMFDKEETQSNGNTESRRKRRALSEVVVVDNLQEDEWVSLLIATLELLFPIMYDNVTNDGRSKYVQQLDTAVRSMAKNMGDESISLKNTSNIAWYVNRVFSIVPGEVIPMYWDNSVQLGEYVNSTYNMWTCSQFGDTCNGIFLVSSQMTGDILSSSLITDKELVSPVFYLNAINPNSNGDFQLLNDSSFDATVTLSLEEKENNMSNVVCHKWNQEKWSVDGCTTITVPENNKQIKCHCSGLGHHIAAFALSEIQYIQIEDQLTTTTPSSTTVSTNTESTSASVSSSTNTFSSTKIKSTVDNSNQGTSSSVMPSNAVSKIIEFSFDGDFDTVTKDDFINVQLSICSKTRLKFGLTESEFKDCSISRGSIIVKFTIVALDTSTLDSKETEIKNSVETGFSITVNGTLLKTKANSFNSKDVHAPSDEKDDNTTIIIVAVVVSVILVACVLIGVVVMMKSKNGDKNKIDPDYKMMKSNGSPRSLDNKQGIENPTYKGDLA